MVSATTAQYSRLESARRIDVLDVVSLWLVLLFWVSARQVIGPLGAIGSPALLVAMLGAGWWAISRVDPAIEADRGIQPLRLYLYAFLWYLLLTFALANMRPLTGLEQTGSVRSLITYVALAGMALLIMDGLDSLAALRRLMRRLVWAVAFMASIGLAQFFTGIPLILRIPGLADLGATAGVGTRSLFNRPFGTALHPIEFSVVLAALFPIAIHMVLEAPAPPRQRRRLGFAAALIGLGIPLSISRSGIVVFVVSMSIMFAGWSWRRRLNALLVGSVALPVLWLGIPGLVGTLGSLFSGTDHDPSIQARLDRVPRIMALIREHPWFGRGVGTYSVEDYFLIDNEMYVSTIELGIVGICLTYGLFLLAMGMAKTTRHHQLATDETTHLGLALCAGIAGLVASTITFDAFYYQILTGTLYLLIGAAGALWRITRRPLQP